MDMDPGRSGSSAAATSGTLICSRQATTHSSLFNMPCQIDQPLLQCIARNAALCSSRHMSNVTKLPKVRTPLSCAAVLGWLLLECTKGCTVNSSAHDALFRMKALAMSMNQLCSQPSES